MKYRKFGELDWQVSSLGFGVMRLPHREKDTSLILEDEAAAIIHYAIDNGVNFLDTAWNYHDGESESFLGKTLKNGYREKVRIATKLPCWKIEKRDDFDRYFDEQMERLQIDFIDFYLLHALQRDWWDKVKNLGYIDWAEKKLADGIIKHLGFSFHDKLPLFKRIIDEYDNWTMTLLMHNYMDVDFQAGAEGVKYATDNGLAVVVMEPLRGGLLAKEPPSSVKKIFDEAVVQRTPADWSLQWLWDKGEIASVISGMNTLQQLQQNITSACNSGIGSMTEYEEEVLVEVREEYRKKASIPCTNCGYCMPCPEGVGIPWIFEYYNMSEMYEAPETARAYYAFLDEENRASGCTECGKCMEQCPQHIDIIDMLKKAHRLLASSQ
ncbi:MAG: aldo/keto reductase [Candidatus Fermentibacteraceae bacterium]|nr:aldo/keto reductase [Candidatus Fermentibacteraceae bacterium]